jgi:positive regulator of sigma E activity
MGYKSGEISHTGLIKSIDGNNIKVMILSKSACSACHSKGMCNMSEMEEKIIDIYNNDHNNYNVGDSVEVLMSLSMGNKAILLGYGIPFIVLLTSLIVFNKIFDNEGLAGLFTIIALIFYYLILSIFRKRISKTFTFKIKRN